MNGNILLLSRRIGKSGSLSSFVEQWLSSNRTKLRGCGVTRRIKGRRKHK